MDWESWGELGNKQWSDERLENKPDCGWATGELSAVLTWAAAFSRPAAHEQRTSVCGGHCDPLYMHIADSSVPTNFSPWIFHPHCLRCPQVSCALPPETDLLTVEASWRGVMLILRISLTSPASYHPPPKGCWGERRKCEAQCRDTTSVQ